MLCKFFLVFWLAATLFFFIPIPIPYLSGWLFAVFASIINMNPESLAIFRFVSFRFVWNGIPKFFSFLFFLTFFSTNWHSFCFVLFCFVFLPQFHPHTYFFFPIPMLLMSLFRNSRQFFFLLLLLWIWFDLIWFQRRI